MVNGETVKRGKIEKSGKTANPTASVKMAIMIKQTRSAIGTNGATVQLTFALEWLNW